MKESTAGTGNGGGRGGGGGGERVRSVSDKERTKMRERQRRSITTNIFHGLRKHGGYPLSARADINEVLRYLANEAGWIVDPDGTTYRPSPTPSGFGCCPLCGGSKRSANSTPTSSVVLGGECSTTASPRRFQVGDSILSGGGGGAPTSLYLAGGGASGAGDVMTSERDIPLALYMYDGIHRSAPTGEPSTATVTYHHQQQPYLQEARASAQNTPLASPLRRT